MFENIICVILLPYDFLADYKKIRLLYKKKKNMFQNMNIESWYMRFGSLFYIVYNFKPFSIVFPPVVFTTEY